MDHRKANELINTTGYFLILKFQSQSLITVFDPYTILVSLLRIFVLRLHFSNIL